jgi:pyrroline-5-carboxylate reductase
MANQKKVAIIGAGVMGEALIAALVLAGVAPAMIAIVEKRRDRADELIGEYGVVSQPLDEAVASNDVILLVVKPQDLQALLQEIAPKINKSALLLSFAAGKRIDFIASHLGSSNPIVRVMPNTPTLIGLGAAGYSCGAGVSPEQRAFVSSLLNAAGKAIEVDESLQSAVTATSGSGPAYFFAFVEAMIDSAIELGLTREDATTLTIQTITGSAALLERSGDSPTTLREKVTSPNGTTAAALASFSESKLGEIINRAMKAAHDRAEELA